jgi:hypothetical protein
MYSIACFSRALRATNYDTILKDKLCNLKILLNQNILLMKGAGIKRLQAFLQCFFNESRLDDVFKNIRDNYKELKEDDDFEQRVFDCFLFYDRFCCLTHPIDSPIKTGLCNYRNWKSIKESFEELKPVFSIYAIPFETYLLNVCIPDEHEYQMWFSLGLEKDFSNFRIKGTRTGSCISPEGSKK